MKERKLKEVFITDVKEYPNILDLFDTDKDDEVTNEEIFNEEDLNNELKVFKKNKKLVPFTYLTKDQFEDLQDIHSVRVIGNVRLRNKFNRKKYDKDEELKKQKKRKNSNVIGCVHFPYTEEYVEKHPNKEFNETRTLEINLYKPKNVSAIGYAYVGGDKFVRIESEKYFLMILIIMLLIGALIFTLTNLKPNDDTPTPNWEDGDSYVAGDDFNNETNIQLDFTSYFKLTEKSPYIPLPNSENNNYALQYDIYLIKPADKDKKQLLTSGETTDGETVLWFDDNSNGKVDKGESIVDELIYSSELVYPDGKNRGIDDIYNKLDAGRYYLLFNINIYNLDGTALTVVPEKFGKDASVNSGFQAITTTVDVVK